jgi:hypothetical protein
MRTYPTIGRAETSVPRRNSNRPSLVSQIVMARVLFRNGAYSGHCSKQLAYLKGACSGLMRRTIIVEPVAACISRSPGAGKKTALRRSLRNPIGCISQMGQYVLFPARNFSQFHSTLMLAARTILAHASVFSITNFARSAGELTNASPPKSVIRSLIV